jgi:hypothetical protein
MAVLDAAKSDDRDRMVRAMNGAIKEWLRVQAVGEPMNSGPRDVS